MVFIWLTCLFCPSPKSQVHGLKKIREIVRAGPFSDVIAEVTSPSNLLSASDESLERHVRQNQQSTWHYRYSLLPPCPGPMPPILADAHSYTSLMRCSCTARMGSPSPGYVCDPRGLVYGVEGLRICDASLMPCVVAGNTQATTYVLGDRVGLFAATHFAKTLDGPRASL